MESNSLVSEEDTNQMKSSAKLGNIKSKFILKLLFNHLERKKILDIVKYNSIKKRININIDDYKEYSENYSSIEIEIKPVNNEYGKFIDIINYHYYHIYFNDNEEEIKRNYLKANRKVKKIKIIIDYEVKSFQDLFKRCDWIE